MLLNNTLFDVDTLLSELQQGPKGTKSALELLQIKLKTHYFDKNTPNEDILKELNNPGFTNFPRLKHVLHEIFSGHANFEIPEDLKDWEPTVTFEQLNNQYGYFNQDLSTLFQQLAVACKKMTSLIERQAHDDEMAYKLMALFYDPNMSIEKNFEGISKKFDKLITTKQDKTIKTPYHDAFVTTLHHFPKFNEVKEFDTWKAFIIKEGFKSLDIFASCATQNPAFENIKEANTFLLAQTYPRAQEHPTLAKLCKALLIKNEGFEAGLKVLQSGWPKKETDNLPLVDIQDNTGQFFWVKLPPQDMRALYLGNLIPGCCQHIGGHSEQCVKDGIELSDNGFYVLLKSKRAQANSNRIVDNQVNDKDYDIVAQSYAWMTKNGNLCLDSIEWNQSRVTTDVIKDLMTKFSKNVFADHPDIKYINVGKSGQTPKGIYPNCPINETMKQGYLYGDAREQYQISCNIPKDKLDALKERLKNVPTKSQNTVLYLAPYFDDIDNVPAQLTIVIDNLPQLIAKINLPPRLSTVDFKKISYEEYLDMEPSQQSSISTVCKIFNSQNETDLKKWLPTIPDEELVCIPLVKNQYSLEFKVAVLQRLPREHQLVTLHELNASNQPILTQSLENPELFKIILELLPENERLETIKEKDALGQSILMRAAYNPESLKMILELLPENDRLEAIKEKNKLGESILMRAAYNPESLKMILELLPENKRLEAVKENNKFGKSILMQAAYYPESLKMILELLPENERLEAVKEKGKYGQSILMEAISNPESLKIILELLPENERLETIKDKDVFGKSTLMHALSEPGSLKMILALYPTDESRLKALKESLMRAVYKPESLKMILELIPENERLEAVKEKDNNGHSILMQAFYYDPLSLKMILELFPENERLEAVKENDKNGESTLTRAVYKPESFKMILELLPENERLEAVKEKDNNGHSILMQAFYYYPLSLKMILELLPENERLEAVKENDKNSESTLTRAVYKPESFKMILELLPENQRLETVKEKDALGRSILMRAISSPESFKIILELLPEKLCIADIKEKDNNGESILMRAISSPESLKILLELLPEKLSLADIKEKDDDGQSILMRATSSPESLKILLELLPEKLSLANIKEKDNYGQSILMRAAYNPEILKILLELIPENQRLEAVKEKDNYGQSILMRAAYNPEILKILLELFPENECLEAIKEIDVSGQSILSYAASNPVCLNIILKTLPKDISAVIEYCLKNLSGNDFEKPTFSMLDFMTNMKGLAMPEAINHFVHAVINNQGIEPALNALLTPPSSSSIFKTNSNEAIQECISKLDNYWLTRIPKVIHDTPTIELPDQSKKQ